MGLTRRDLLKGGGLAVAGMATGSAALLPTVSGCTKEEHMAPKGEYIPSSFRETQQGIKTDLLIIGSGFAGLWAAITAWDNGVRDITIVDKVSTVPMNS